MTEQNPAIDAILEALLSDPKSADAHDRKAAADLLASGLTPETVKTAGIHIFRGNRADLSKQLGRTKIDGSELLQTGSLIVFPYSNQAGEQEFIRVKPVPSVGEIRYLQPAGTPIRPYIPAGTWSVADKDSKPLWITEGEKKTLALTQAGRHTIGLSGVWNFKNQSAPMLPDLREFAWRGRSVYLAFDADGETNQGVRMALAELSVKLMALGAVVRVASWTGGKGIDDHLVTCADPAAELERIETTAAPFPEFVRPDHSPEWARAVAVTVGMSPILEEQLVKAIAAKTGVKPSTVEREIDKRRDQTTNEEKPKSPLKVLGSTPDGDILLYRSGKMFRVSVPKLTPAWLQVLTGIKSDDKLKRMARDIRLEANKAGTFDPDKRIGTGIWRIKDTWVIVSGLEALIIDGSNVTITTDPVYQGHVIEFDGADVWLNLSTVKRAIAEGNLRATFAETLAITKQWRWTTDGMAEYATANIALAPFQRALEWRPIVSITGPSGCGKSLFADDFAGRMYGPLVVRSDRATAHSVAQTVGSTARVLILDEFERNKRIAEILDLLKLSGRGGFKTSGTGERSALKYEMRHLVWILGAHLPAALKTDTAKANRVVKLSMNGGREGKPPIIPTEDQYRDLASRLVGSIIREWPVIEANETTINARQAELFEKHPGANSRTIDIFRSASALLRVAVGGDWTIPAWGAEPLPSDGDMVLEAILGAMMPGQPGTTIEQLLKNSESNTRPLEAVGIKIATHGGQRYLAIQPTQARNHLLKNTEFAEMDIQEALERLPGAVKDKAKLEKVSRLVVFVPVELTENPERQPRQPCGNHSGNHETLINKGLSSNGCQVADILPSENTEDIPAATRQKNEPPKTPPILSGQSSATAATGHLNPSNDAPLPVAATVAGGLPVADLVAGRTPPKPPKPISRVRV